MSPLRFVFDLACTLAAMLKTLSPVIRAISKLGGVLQTVSALGGGVTAVMVRWWMKRDHVPPEHAVRLCQRSGLSIEEFAAHEKTKYLAKAEAFRFAVPP